MAIAKEEADRKRQIELDRLSAMSQLFGNLATLMNAQNRKLFEIGKAAAIAQAIVNTATAVTNALAVPPFPLGLALAVTAGVAGAVQIATIQNQKFSGARAMGGAQGISVSTAGVITFGANAYVNLTLSTSGTSMTSTTTLPGWTVSFNTLQSTIQNSRQWLS